VIVLTLSPFHPPAKVEEQTVSYGFEDYILTSLGASPSFRRSIFKEKKLIPCLACKAGVRGLSLVFSNHLLQTLITQVMKLVCPFIADILNPAICPGTITTM
jgi:hypothetical protein